jgi:hypothetical protein
MEGDDLSPTFLDLQAQPVIPGPAQVGDPDTERGHSRAYGSGVRANRLEGHRNGKDQGQVFGDQLGERIPLRRRSDSAGEASRG